MKTCPSCETTKSLDMFSKASARYDGLQSHCKSCRSARRKADYIKNKDRELDLAKVWVKDNPDLVKLKAKRYRQKEDNKPTQLANNARRRASNRNATPAWLTDEQSDDIKTMYVLAKKFEKLCNIRYHVDHIVPLAGKDVCGLHVPWNLQLLPASVNIAKGNKYNEEALRSQS